MTYKVDLGSRFCMYLRKSRADMLKEAMGEFETLAQHEQTLLETARRMGVTITETYREIVSAESIQDRPQMQRLIADINAGKWDGVFVVEIERLSRGDATDQGTVGNAFLYSDTLIITPMKVYDPMSESDMEYFEFGLFMSRREYKTIRRRLLNGKLDKCREGQYIGRLAPYGYDKVRVSGKKTLAPNADAKYVRMMFELYDSGMSMRGIAKRLTAMQVPTRFGGSLKGDEWNQSTVKQILCNVVYLGMIRWNNRLLKKDGSGRKKTVANKTPDVFNGLHEAIVDKALFDRVQARLALNEPPVKGEKVLRNHYAKLIFCKRCGVALTYDSHRPSPYLVHKGDCPEKSCKVASVDAVVSETLERLAEGLEFELKDDNAAMRRAHYLMQKNHLEKEISTAKKAIGENFDRVERGIIDEEDFAERRAVLKERIAKAQVTLAELAEPSDEDTRARVATVHEALKALRSPEVSAQRKNDLLRSVIARIEYLNDSPAGSDERMHLDIFLR